MNQSQVMGQSCAITAHGGPRCLTFAPRRLKNRIFFDTNHMQHTVAFTGSELWASFNFSYSTASANLLFNFKNFSGASNFAGFLPVYDNIFGSFFPGLIQPPERVFQDYNGYWSILLTGFFKKIQCSHVQVSRTSDFAEFPSSKNVKNKNKNKQTKKTPGLCKILGGVCDRVIDALNSGSGDPGFKPRPPRCFLDNKLYSTLFLFTQVYKWVPVTYCWERGVGITLRQTSILSRGEQQYSWACFMLKKPG